MARIVCVRAVASAIVCERVARESSLGQQVIGLHRTGSVAPCTCHGEPGQCGTGTLTRIDERRHRRAEHEEAAAEAGLEPARDLTERQIGCRILGSGGLLGAPHHEHQA